MLTNVAMSQLLKINTVQEEIIEKQAGIINELFVLVCQHTAIDELDGMEPLLTSMRDAAERTEECRQ